MNFKSRSSFSLSCFSDLNVVERSTIHRILQALLREQFIFLKKEKDKWVIPLVYAQVGGNFSLDEWLEIKTLHITQLKYYLFLSPIIYYAEGASKHYVIESAASLLRVVKPCLSRWINPHALKRFMGEIENHMVNEDQALAQKQKDNGLLSDALVNLGTGLYEWVLAGNVKDIFLFFEQYAIKGHPYHPCAKTKMGWSCAESVTYSPEFHPQVPLLISALSLNKVIIQTKLKHFNYADWFFSYFPEVKEQWHMALIAKGKNPMDFIPIPLHPWQASLIIKEKFSILLKNQSLFIFDSIVLLSEPTLSFRTMVCSNLMKTAPYIKLSVGVQSTSAFRTISWGAVQNGPIISCLLEKLVTQAGCGNGYLHIQKELVGLHIKDVVADEGKHLSVIYRENPHHLIQSNQVPIVLAALFEKMPQSDLPLFSELFRVTQCKTHDDILSYFERYCSIMLQSYLDLYLLYGIAVEGHQQNVIAVFENGELVGTVIRDFGGIRIYMPALNASGYSEELKLDHHSPIICYEREMVRNKLLHTLYEYHLGEWAKQLDIYYKIPEHLVWKKIATLTEKRFAALKSKMNKKVWELERQAILNDSWPLKALMRMRLSDDGIQDYIHLFLPNPLKKS